MLPLLSYDLFFWGLGLVLTFAPGLLLAVWLFPNEQPVWQGAVGCGLSLALLGGLALGLSYVPGGLTVTSLTIVLVGLTGALGLLVAATRRADLFRLVNRARQASVPQGSIVAGLVVFAVLLGFLLLTPAATEGKKERFTEFYLPDAALTSAPWQRPVPLTESVPVKIAVVSHEQTAESFTVQMVSNGVTIASLDLGVLGPDTPVVRTVTLPPRTQMAQQYSLFLYKEGDQTPYRTLRFWVKITP